MKTNTILVLTSVVTALALVANATVTVLQYRQNQRIAERFNVYA